MKDMGIVHLSFYFYIETETFCNKLHSLNRVLEEKLKLLPVKY
jgi:hypothetical protein